MSHHQRAKRNRHGLRNLVLVLGALALLDGNRRWNQRFVSTELGAAQIKDRAGAPRNGRRIVVQSVLDATPDKVWARVKQTSAWAEVSHPLLGFVTRDGRDLPEEWRPGEKVALRLLGLGAIPLGDHDIAVARVDDKTRELESHESGQMAAVWNHLIHVKPYGDGQALYTDEVDLVAGPLNPLVGQLAYLYFRYRQTRWQALARTL